MGSRASRRLTKESVSSGLRLVASRPRAGVVCPLTCEEQRGPRPNGEAVMRRTRDLGQLALDTARESGMMNVGESDTAPSGKGVKGFLGT
jgi:hypothetical protein